MTRPIGMTLGAFDPKRDLQVFRNIIQALSIDGYTVEEAIEYIDMVFDSIYDPSLNMLTKEQREYMIDKYSILCPKCNSPMALFDTPNNNKGHKGVWRCVRGWGCIGCSDKQKFDNVDPDTLCGYEEFVGITGAQFKKEYNYELNKFIEENKNGS
jgi:hypothetical protein